MKKKIRFKLNLFLFATLFIFLVLPLAIAEEGDESPTFQYNRAFDLKRVCTIDGFYCDSNFICNITLTYPDGNILINNQLMTNNQSFRNFSITQVQNNQLGIIKVIQSCNNGTNAGADTYDVIITADGNKFQAFPNEFFIIIFGFLMIATGMTLDRLRMFKHLGSLLIMVMGVITLFPGYNFINYSNLIGQSLGSVLIGIGFFFLIEDSFSRDTQEEGFDSQSQFTE